MQVRLSTATRARPGATLYSTRERLSACTRLPCGVHFVVAGGGLRAELRQMRIVVLCRTGVIHDPVRQTCMFDTEWSGGSSGGGRRLVEEIEPTECAVDPSEVTQALGVVKRQTGKASAETSEVKMELSGVKQQLRKAEVAADDMKQQVVDISGELREVKALLKQLATA